MAPGLVLVDLPTSQPHLYAPRRTNSSTASRARTDRRTDRHAGLSQPPRGNCRDGGRRLAPHWDVGRFDEDGYLTLVDRIKDLIIRGGENLYPKEIESTLYEAQGVLEAAVIGRPDSVSGEVPVAYVVPYPEATTSIEDLLAHCRAHLRRVEVPVTITDGEVFGLHGIADPRPSARIAMRRWCGCGAAGAVPAWILAQGPSIGVGGTRGVRRCPFGWSTRRGGSPCGDGGITAPS